MSLLPAVAADLLPVAKAALRVALFLGLTAALIVPQIIVAFSCGGSRIVYAIPRLWHKTVCRIFGIKIEVRGTPVTDRQALYVANHISYLDIPVLTSILETSFVAKAEVARWPLFGLLAKLQQTAFISRARGDAMKTSADLSTIIAGGKNLVIFPEGTSSNGASVLPFKSALFSAALENAGAESALAIQPVTIEIAAIEGAPPVTDARRDIYAWHGDMTLVPHLWNFGKCRGATIRLHFHTPRKPQDYTDRKTLAGLCHQDVLAPLAGAGLANAA